MTTGGRGMSHKGFPAKVGFEIIDALIMARDVGNLVAYLFDHARFALR
jgi:hypothetical protein